MKYDSGNSPSFQQIPKQHNAHVLAYTLHRMDFEQMEMRVASFGSYKRPRTEKMDIITNRIAHSTAFSFEQVAASAHEAWTKANPEKHDAHVKAYNQDFINQLLSIYKRHRMMRDQFHANPITVGVDLDYGQDHSSFWKVYDKDNLFSSPPAQPTQTSGVAKQVSSSFRELTDSIDNKLTELGIDREEFITADYKTSNSYLSFKMLKPRPKSPVFIPVFIDLSNYQRQGGKTDLIDAMREAFLGTHITGSGTDMAGYNKTSDAEINRPVEFCKAETTGGMRRGNLEPFVVYNTAEGKTNIWWYVDESHYVSQPVTKDSGTDQTYKKRKHIPNNQEAQKDRKAKLLAKNKFFK